MAGKPAQPHDASSRDARSAADAGERAARAAPGGDPHERIGPLLLTRMAKPDGRALLVYARVDEPSGSHQSRSPK
jgi:hypothetical protein